jgi:prepilin-type N-terminal cleavage/methylation domain-containing protein
MSSLVSDNSIRSGVGAALCKNAKFMCFLRPRAQGRADGAERRGAQRQYDSAERYDGARGKVLLAQSHRRRAGFTLVEVIVVLVILAILAAIAIPALTGYIDKAELRSIVSKIHTQRVAVQTILNERYAEEGEFPLIHIDAADFTDTNDIFAKVRTIPTGLEFTGFTAPGIAEYEKLTGDTGTFSLDPRKSFIANTDFKGSIEVYKYTATNYFGTNKDLVVLYFASTPGEYYKTSTDGLQYSTEGYNVFSYSSVAPKIYTKLY